MIFRCPECRTRRKDFDLFTKHIKNSGHKICTCGGYPYSHRPKSTFCEKNPASIYYDAMRNGADDSDLNKIIDFLDETPVSHSFIKTVEGN